MAEKIEPTINCRQANFSLQRQKPSTPSPKEDRKDMKKSSYELPMDYHKDLKRLCAEQDRKLNELFLEALEDLLHKYHIR